MRKFKNIIEEKESLIRKFEREEKLKNYTNRFKYERKKNIG